MARLPNDYARCVVKEFFDVHYSELVAIVMRWTGVRNDATEIINELYTKWDLRPPNLPNDHKQRLRYVTKSLYNLWRRELGKSQKQSLCDLEKAESEAPSHASQVEIDTAIQRITRKGKLTVRESALLDLHSQGYSRKEIAEELGMEDADAVRKALFTITRRLKKVINRKDISP